MEQLIIQLLQNVLGALASIILGYVVAFIHKRLGTEGMKKIEAQLQAHSALAELVIRAVEETYISLTGAEKYAMASKMLSDRLSKIGVTLSVEDIHTLIQGTLSKMRDQFADNWKKAESEPTSEPTPTPDANQPVPPINHVPQ